MYLRVPLNPVSAFKIMNKDKTEMHVRNKNTDKEFTSVNRKIIIKIKLPMHILFCLIFIKSIILKLNVIAYARSAPKPKESMHEGVRI